MPTALLAVDDLQLGFERCDALAAVVDLRRHGVLADRHAGTGRIEQAHRLVRQLPGRDVAMRQLHGRFERFVENLHAMMLFERRGHAAHHEDRLFLAGLVDLNDLEAAGEGRVLLDVLLVFGPGGGRDRAQLAAGQGRLEQVGRVAGARRAAGTDQRVGLVDEQDDGLRRCLDFFDDLLAGGSSNSPFMLAPACSSPTSRARSVTSLQRRRHIAGGDSQAQSLPRRPSCRRPPRR